jgi:hypothetical protein
MEIIYQISRQVLTGLFLVMSFILTGCGTSVETALTETVTETASVVQNPSTPTLIPLLSPTVTPSPRSSLTPVPPPRTPTTPLPTLPVEEQEAYLLNLIETNGDCELPCLLGIQPGESFWEELRKVVTPIHFIEDYTPNEAGFFRIPFSVNQENHPNFELTFTGTENTIDHIAVDARIYLPDDPVGYFPSFAEVMRQYSLPNVLSEHGVPSRILLEVQGQVDPGAGTQASILLFYDNAGILINYWFLDVVTQDPNTGILEACLDYEHNYSISLYLQNPNDKTPLERMIGAEDDYALNVLLKPLEEITTIGIEDFYRLFVDSDDSACFKVP